MQCIKCKSDDVIVQIVKVNKRGKYSFSMFFQMITNNYSLAILLCLPLIGWLIIAIIFFKGYKISEETRAVCQNCGTNWTI